MNVETRLKVIEGHLQELRLALLRARNHEKTALFTQRYASPSKKIGDVEQAYKELATPRLRGHSAQHHGLQKHSVGDIYPWAVVGIANGAVTHYEIHNLVTDAKVMCSRRENVKRFVDSHALRDACACVDDLLRVPYDIFQNRWRAYLLPTSSTSRR